MFKLRRLLLPTLVVSLMFLSLACAAGAEDDSGGDVFAASESGEESSIRDGATLVDADGSAASTQQPIGAPAPSSGSESTQGVSTQGGTTESADISFSGQNSSVAPQARLIVRTVDMTMEVVDVAATMNSIGEVAAQYGGWIVSEQRSSRHTGWISIRVPSAELDAAVGNVSALGLDVTSLISSSVDVTEEYFDVEARISNLYDTADSLRQLLIREGELEDILEVQRELTRVSEEIEVLEGRKRYLEQTSATSLINVRLELAPVDMRADAGTDLQAVEGRVVNFRATFRPPEGIDSFVYSWDFGDGNGIEGLTRTASTVNEGEWTTQTVAHVFGSVDQSPYFATFEIRGTGEAGAAIGDDSLQVTVSRVPTIQVSAPSAVTIRANNEATFVGVFTRPQDIVNLRYEWDFGDGLAPEAGAIDDDQTAVEATHTYGIDRREPYSARFTVTGETSFGAVITSSAHVDVYVEPGSQWVVGIVDIGETARGATRALSALAQIMLALAIVVVVFSPALIGIGAVVWILRRTGIWRGTKSRLGRVFKSPPLPPRGDDEPPTPSSADAEDEPPPPERNP